MLMEQPSRKAKNTVGEKKGVTPQSVVAEGNAKKPSPDSLQKPGNSSGNPRVSFWIRLKTFTFEPPKKVIVEGDTIRLVPVSPETETTVGEKEISVITEELTAVVVETPGGKGGAESQTLLTPEELVSPLPEIVLGEEPVVIREEIPLSTEKLKKGLEKTRTRFWSRLKGLFSFRRKIDDSVLEELEDILIGADIGAKS
ncbi:MAG: hypothetical protein F9K48_11020, partial [Candidatus Brocadia sp.]